MKSRMRLAPARSSPGSAATNRAERWPAASPMISRRRSAMSRWRQLVSKASRPSATIPANLAAASRMCSTRSASGRA